jgi:hypothetical protein
LFGKKTGNPLAHDRVILMARRLNAIGGRRTMTETSPADSTSAVSVQPTAEPKRIPARPNETARPEYCGLA